MGLRGFRGLKVFGLSGLGFQGFRVLVSRVESRILVVARYRMFNDVLSIFRFHPSILP